MNLADLLTKEYWLFPIKKMYSLDYDYSITHHQFAELIIVWIKKNKPCYRDATSLFQCLREQLLYGSDGTYLAGVVEHQITDHYPVESFDYNIEVEKRRKSQSVFRDAVVQIPEDTPFDSIDVAFKCEGCGSDSNCRVKIVDKVPCYEVEIDDLQCFNTLQHVSMNHYKVEIDRVSYAPTVMYGFNEGRLFSLVTNDCVTVTEKIKSSWIAEDRIAVHIIYKCNAA